MKGQYQKVINRSWEILEHCYRYYVLDKPILEDWEFDKLKRNHQDWCAVLGLEYVDMVGFDETRPSCQLVAFKFKNGLLK
jgi:NAD-dependent DNA ligase